MSQENGCGVREEGSQLSTSGISAAATRLSCPPLRQEVCGERKLGYRRVGSSG